MRLGSHEKVCLCAWRFFRFEVWMLCPFAKLLAVGVRLTLLLRCILLRSLYLPWGGRCGYVCLVSGIGLLSVVFWVRLWIKRVLTRWTKSLTAIWLMELGSSELLCETVANGFGLRQLFLPSEQTCGFNFVVRSCFTYGVFQCAALFQKATVLLWSPLGYSYPLSLGSSKSYSSGTCLLSQTRALAMRVLATMASYVPRVAHWRGLCGLTC